jgi:DNA-binding transcriptional regulator LsrR (DeoR family)
MEGVRDAFEHARDLDLVVTSAGAHWSKGCSGLNNKLRESDPESVRTLDQDGALGDMIWQPFGPNGPLPTRLGKRAVTLLDLSDLPALVAGGTRVMLVLAPCAGEVCGEPKGEMLGAILGWRGGVTDLVVDARTAAMSLPP